MGNGGSCPEHRQNPLSAATQDRKQGLTPCLHYSMVLFTGLVFTEIEALQTLTGVSVLHVASGGIGGAEGSVRLLLRGSNQQVEDALKVIESIQGEPPFVP